MVKFQYCPAVCGGVRYGVARSAVIKAAYCQVWLRGVLRASALSSLARCLFVWCGLARSSEVRRCTDGQGFITAWRSLALFGTVLSGPVLRVKASSFEPWSGVAERCPVRLGQAVFSSVLLGFVRRFQVRSRFVGRSIVVWGFVFLGKALSGHCEDRHSVVLHGEEMRCKVSSWSGDVRFAIAGFCGVRYSLASSWLGEVLFGLAGRSGAQFSIARRGLASSRRGVVLSDDVLHSVVKFGPVKHSTVSLGVSWQGGAEQSEVHRAEPSSRIGKVRWSLASCCRLRFHFGLALPGEVGRRIAKHALVSLRLSWAWRSPVSQGLLSLMQGAVSRCAVKRSSARRSPAFFGRVQVGLVRRGPAMFSPAWHGLASLGKVELSKVLRGPVWQSFVTCCTVRCGLHRYGGIQK